MYSVERKPGGVIHYTVGAHTVVVAPDGALPWWTVYDHPTDIPDAYVARLSFVMAGRTAATPLTLRHPDLEVLRATLRDHLGLTCLPRQPEDDPVIVESWI